VAERSCTAAGLSWLPWSESDALPDKQAGGGARELTTVAERLEAGEPHWLRAPKGAGSGQHSMWRAFLAPLATCRAEARALCGSAQAGWWRVCGRNVIEKSLAAPNTQLAQPPLKLPGLGPNARALIDSELLRACAADRS